jgi:uncharacterized protein (TIGR03067 family)
MRYILATIVIASCCIPLPAQDRPEDTAKLRAEVARLQSQVEQLTKMVRDVQAEAAEAKKFEGTWIIETARQNGKVITSEQGGEIEFFGNVAFARFPGRKEVIRQSFRVSPTEQQIAYLSATGMPTLTSFDYVSGRYKLDGDTLRVSVLGYGIPKDLSDRDGQRMWVLKRKKD